MSETDDFNFSLDHIIQQYELGKSEQGQNKTFHKSKNGYIQYSPHVSLIAKSFTRYKMLELSQL